MSNRNRKFVHFWAKNPETRMWVSVSLWDTWAGRTATLGGNYKETFEGWRTHRAQYTLRGNTVYLETIDDVLDCDGRVTRTWEGTWDVGGPLKEDRRSGLLVPEFVEVQVSHRDYRAEKAGY